MRSLTSYARAERNRAAIDRSQPSPFEVAARKEAERRKSLIADLTSKQAAVNRQLHAARTASAVQKVRDLEHRLANLQRLISEIEARPTMEQFK